MEIVVTRVLNPVRVQILPPPTAGIAGEPSFAPLRLAPLWRRERRF